MSSTPEWRMIMKHATTAWTHCVALYDDHGRPLTVGHVTTAVPVAGVYRVDTASEAARIATQARSGENGAPHGVRRVRTAYVILWPVRGAESMPPEVYVTPWGAVCGRLPLGTLYTRVTLDQMQERIIP